MSTIPTTAENLAAYNKNRADYYKWRDMISLREGPDHSEACVTNSAGQTRRKVWK